MNFCVKSNGFGKGCGAQAVPLSKHMHIATLTEKRKGLGVLLYWKNKQSSQEWICPVKQIWF